MSYFDPYSMLIR